MAWVWGESREFGNFGAAIDYKASAIRDIDVLSAARTVDEKKGYPVYKSRSKLARFIKLHCPPFDTVPVADRVWQEIILKFVPTDHVQFYPIRLIARGEECMDFSWVLPFDRVRCIDLKRSKIISKIEKPDITYIFRCDEYAHIDGCLGGKHLARDEQQLSHVVVSDELRDALAATGESGMFYQPENVPTLFGKNGVNPTLN